MPDKRAISSGLSLSPGRLRLAWFVVLAAVIAANVAVFMLRAKNAPFEPDECQHLHMAWQSSLGQTVYKDFFDHHGPLYTLLNGVLVASFSPEPSWGTLLFLRGTSLLYLCCLLLLSYLLGVEIFRLRLAGLICALVFSSFFVVAERGLQVRPDVIQNVFWLAGLILVVRGARIDRAWISLVAGVCLALAVQSNVKALLPIAPTLGGLALACIFVKSLRGPLGRHFLLIASGFAAVTLTFIAVFAAAGMLQQYFTSAYVFNFLMMPDRRFGLLAARHAIEYLLPQLPLYLLAIFGLILFVRSALWRPGQSTDRVRYFLFAVAALFATSAWGLGLHGHNLLMSAPLLAVAAARAIDFFVALVKGRGVMARAAVPVLLSLLCGWSAFYSWWQTPLAQGEMQAMQQRELDEVLRTLPRESPMVAMDGPCVSHVFNANFGYYWYFHPRHVYALERLGRPHPFGREFATRFQQRPPECISMTLHHLRRHVPPGMQRYLLRHYEPRVGCLLCKRQEPGRQ
jgi:hypothetical protein